MTDIPPPRYRVVEHKGRITVTDTWADGARPAAPKSPVPLTGARPSGSPPITPRGRDAGTRTPGFLRRLAFAACFGVADADGRPIFITASWFDPQAPRQIVLDDASARWLGGTIAATAGAAIAVMGLIGWFGINALFPMIVFAMIFGRRPARFFAWWLERFPTLPRD